MLKQGSRLGPYEITGQLGAGGMGEVYRARDTKLGRDVAIKVLPEEFTQHPEKLARFDREARFLASLNHPGIATLHGLEKADGKPFLVMELVEGETLAERIAGGPLPVLEAMKLAQQIAEALEAAHEKGVIHRDLKPANIKVADGKVKVLDFGLAKAFGDDVPESDLSQSPTLSRDATQSGVILGTAVYMSPEQARGKAVDKRTDIFSFGAVLYEMLTGKKAFLGEDVQEVLANVIKGEPDWKALPANTPPSVSALVRRCLTKDRKQRLQAIGEARIAAERYLAEPTSSATSESVKARVPLLAWVAALGFGLAFVTMGWLYWQTTSEPQHPRRLEVKLGAGDHQLTFATNYDGGLAVLSPGGETMAFVGLGAGTRQIYVRALDNLEATALSGAQPAASPFFSPDGKSLAFFSGAALKTVSLSGGAAITIAENRENRGGTWGPDDTIVYVPSPQSGLYRVPASGGTAVELTTLREGELNHRWPSFLPNGKAVLFAVETQANSFRDRFDPQSSDNDTIEAYVLETGERKILHRGGTHPRYASTGHLLYARGTTLFAMPFDADRIEPTGEPRPVVEGVQHAPGSGASYYSVADDGSLVYVSEEFSTSEVLRQLVRVDREGNASPLTETRGDWETPRFSRDGNRVAVRKGVSPQEVWILELSRGTLQRLTFDGGYLPLWSPSAEEVFFTSARATPPSIFSKPANGSGPALQLTKGVFRIPASITSDGKTLVFRQGGDAGSPSLDVGLLHLDRDGKLEMLLDSPFNEHSATLSPDDRWLAYVSDESGREEVYVTSFPPPGKWQISTNGGKEPMWSRDGRELFYRNDTKMMAVDVSQGADKAGPPIVLFDQAYDSKLGSGAPNYDVAPDGQGFVMIRSIEGGTQESGVDSVTLVLDWFEELKRLVPTE